MAPELREKLEEWTGRRGDVPVGLIHGDLFRDNVLWEFLDIFNHRMLSLFYRAWEKYRFAIAYERRDPEQPDPVTHVLLHLIGIGCRRARSRRIREHVQICKG